MTTDGVTGVVPAGDRRPGGALAHVRAATSRAHEELDGSLDVLHRPWDVDLHRRWLELTLGLLDPLEASLARWARTDPAALDVAARARAGLARGDLRALGADEAAVSAVPLCPDVPGAADRAQALGLCYVLDGSTLGGTLIHRTAVAAGVPERACTSLVGRPGAGRRWRETAAAVDALGAPGDAAVEEMTATALAAFAAYRRWLAPLARASA
ncbi:biliverdin-producing heme oxygenase [Paenibacillus sp. TRM 82003]|uniref:biliverdin-producing heme oxygenase n=1 Tax=Kineococcus sp. TRM81007 TaxID=2925831 RepID=UPI001F594BB1|nr:biliverdin-producing heme oxygenase [Kineococcus sp. TRM81007]MCI2238196.1 biliverdin-producing heme oxygenase [Kineococcus sp. TRM81007]MCI3920580.1 biliverdin-producing heme oxygenase [Paenibacillus sp. TRM 82003]